MTVVSLQHYAYCSRWNIIVYMRKTWLCNKKYSIFSAVHSAASGSRRVVFFFLKLMSLITKASLQDFFEFNKTIFSLAFIYQSWEKPKTQTSVPLKACQFK